MSKLLVEGEMRWSIDLIRGIFEDEVVELICSIPLSIRKPKDKMRQIYTKDGNYSVCSGYFVARKSTEMGASSSKSNANFWKKLGKLPVHHWVRSFMWRLGHNILSTKGNLFVKQCALDRDCGICGAGDEHLGHVFKGCGWVEEVWEILGAQDVLELSGVNGRDWFYNVLELKGVEVASLCAYGLWTVWGAWNDFVFNNRGLDARMAVERARNGFLSHLQVLDEQRRLAQPKVVRLC